jgi:hypothetical protein
MRQTALSPHTATGKILKTALRDQLRDFRWPVTD